MKTAWWIVFSAAASLAGAADLFVDQIHPVLSKRCVHCHSGDQAQGGLSFKSRELLMKGGKSGPALTPGEAPASSLLVRKLRGASGLRMPPSGDPLSATEIAAFERWIAEGAVWPDMTARLQSGWNAPLAPRKPPVPDGTARNPIDRFIAAYAKKNGIALAAPVNDMRFARRVYYDAWGLPPTASQLNVFENSRQASKREDLVKSLLANNANYTAHWISFWNDLLRNDIGVVYHGERKSITPWLQKALESNMPYDEMVRQLVNPAEKTGPDGFLIGVNWRGDVNASQLPHIQASQNTAQIFLGINLKCASCHDSFINKYKLRQAYGLAAMFSANSKLELIRCDANTGQFTEAEFLYPELGAISPGASLPERRAGAAKLFTHPQNGRLARTIVNRYWQRLVGRGLVENVDEMDAEPWNADLLDWLASDFSEHNYDLKYLLELIMTSEAYQLPAVAQGGELSPVQYMFRGPSARRLTAEQFLDTVSAITGEWRTLAQGETARYAREWELKSSDLSRALGRPIRDQVYTTRNDAPTTFQSLELANGQTLTTLLRRGARRMLGELPPPPANKFDSKAMRQGIANLDVDISGARQLWLLTEDVGSYDPAATIAGWVDVELSGPQGTKKLSELAGVAKTAKGKINAAKESLDADIAALGTTMKFDIDGMGFTRIRGRVAVDDSSRASDIGANVRFFVFTEEPDRYQLLRIAGARPVEAENLMSNRLLNDRLEVVRALFPALLARKASVKELATLMPAKLLVKKLQPAELEDILWTLLMHPEFQYIL